MGKGLKDIRLYLAFFATAVIILFLYPEKGGFIYQYQTGRPWIYETLIADFDFPILKKPDQLLQEREEKASQVLDYYILNDELSLKMVSAFNNAGIGEQQDTISSILEDAYTRGIMPQQPDDKDSYGKVIFVKKGKRAKEIPVSEVFTTDQVYLQINSALAANHSQRYADSLCESVKIRDYIVPNLIYDNATTQIMHKEAVDYISPTIGTIYTGQLIVSNGEIVTREIKQLLDSYKSEYNASFSIGSSTSLLMVTHILTIFILVSLLFLTIYFTDKSILESYRKYLFVLLLQLLGFLLIVIAKQMDSTLIYVLPLSLYVIYTQAFFKNKFVYPSYLIVIMPLLFLCDNGIALYFMNAAAGAVLLVSYPKLNRGWLQFLNVLFLFITLMIVHIAFNLDGGTIITKNEITYLAIHSVLAIIGYPFVFLLESIFGLVSRVRLWELTDTNNDLLRDLAHKAPGTFQHSLQVANIAEEAAEKLGADKMLVRAGALYHDIGKMYDPKYFIENQAGGANCHSELSPQESAAQIIRHVEEGMELAKKYLPDEVSDFITTHHGDSLTAYFYNKYISEGGDPANKSEFKYHGKLPQTREQSIVMICDTVEAASRSLKSYTSDTITALVNRLVQSKIDEGQLLESEISFKEIEIVKKCLVDRLEHIYHARIDYKTSDKK